MKKEMQTFIVLIALTAILLSAIFIVLYCSDSYKIVEDAISDLTGLDITQVDIKITKEEGKYLFAFYQANNTSDIQLLCLEKNAVDSYNFVGSSHSNNQVDIFQWGSGEELVFVIYGNNEVIKANNYTFGYKDKEYSINITEPYFLDVFTIANQGYFSSLVDSCVLYDDQGNKLKVVL